MTSTILQGSVFDTLPTIAPGTVDCVVTSPPYWMLRSYLPNGHALKGHELGSEPTPAAFVENLVKVFRLVRTCLADHGTVWINIGDTYSHSPGKRKTSDAYGDKQKTNGFEGTIENASAPGLDGGNLCLIPQRLAIALQDDGWLIRSVIVWHKPAPMPASVSGWMWRRCRVKVEKAPRRHKGHERLQGEYGDDGKNFATGAQWSDCPGCPRCTPNGGYVLRRGSWRPTSSWEPILMLAKSKNYFADGEAVKQPTAAATVSRNKYTRVLDDGGEYAAKHDHEEWGDEAAGANLRDVWTIANPLMRLRTDLTAEQRREVLSRLLAAGL